MNDRLIDIKNIFQESMSSDINMSDEDLSEGIIVGVIATFALYNYLKRKADKIRQKYIDDNNDKCNNLSGEKKKLCINGLRRRADKMKLFQLKKSLILCNKAKNPTKCKELLQASVDKLRHVL